MISDFSHPLTSWHSVGHTDDWLIQILHIGVRSMSLWYLTFISFEFK